MATQIVQAPTSADHTGDAPCGTRTARGMRTPTGDFMTCVGGHGPNDQHGAPFGTSGWFSWSGEQASLPPVAAKMLARLLTQFPLVRAVAQYETAAERVTQLAPLAESDQMSDLDADSLAAAEDIMAAARTVLEAAGRLDLIGEA